MLDKSTFEERHRERKRKAEMAIAIDRIAPYVKEKARRRIFEFGSGEGYQLAYLKRLGSLIASDIKIYEQAIRENPEVKYVACDIRNASFASNSFDLIFSNHVLEHIEDIKRAFSEMKRIGDKNCIYAFTVPTSTWLFLSVPAQFHNALKRFFKKEPERKTRERERNGRTEIKGWRRFFPVGHGWRKDFFECLRCFKMKNWERLFRENGFKILEKTPLLLYAPSEFSIVPTTRFLADKGLFSSAIFILKKREY